MGEARRRELAGHTEPNPRYRKTRKVTQKEIHQASMKLMSQLLSGYPKSPKKE